MAANEPIYFGLGASLVAYIVGSLASPRTPDSVISVWNRRLKGSAVTEEEAAAALEAVKA
jgi:SSS family solute:Na+ symporter